MISRPKSTGKTLTPFLVIFSFVILTTMILLSLRSLKSSRLDGRSSMDSVHS